MAEVYIPSFKHQFPAPATNQVPQGAVAGYALGSALSGVAQGIMENEITRRSLSDTADALEAVSPETASIVRAQAKNIPYFSFGGGGGGGSGGGGGGGGGGGAPFGVAGKAVDFGFNMAMENTTAANRTALENLRTSNESGLTNERHALELARLGQLDANDAAASVRDGTYQERQGELMRQFEQIKSDNAIKEAAFRASLTGLPGSNADDLLKLKVALFRNDMNKPSELNAINAQLGSPNSVLPNNAPEQARANYATSLMEYIDRGLEAASSGMRAGLFPGPEREASSAPVSDVQDLTGRLGQWEIQGRTD